MKLDIKNNKKGMRDKISFSELVHIWHMGISLL